MADNVQANAGAGGATFATDDIGGIHHPYTKVEWGPADTANITDDAAGKRLPVKVGDPLPAGTNNIGDVDVVSTPKSSTPAQSTVADNASNVTILASNASRLGAGISNDSSAALLLKLGATASATSYTVRLVRYAYFEVPYGYTGIIDGIWETDPGDGAARITELTA